jgi:cis-3-alkyl-4-acyloxetan-2-one decarboxylase
VQVSRELYPFESQSLDLDGLRYHYLDEGSGEPLVMVHGNPSWSFYYRHLVSGLSDRYRCIVPDHIGCGLSDKPSDDGYDYHLERRVDDLEALLEQLGVTQDVTLVLHDWGGMIGMAWAERHPEAVRRLVLLNTAAFHLPKTKRVPWQIRLTRTPLGTVLVRGLNAFSLGATYMGVARRPMPREVREAYCAPYDSWKNRIATLRFVEDIPLSETDRGYGLISDVEASLDGFSDRPTLICWGEKDFVFDKHFLAVWEDKLPQAQVRRFPDSGHYVLEDAPEEILEEVTRFLTANPLEGATK